MAKIITPTKARTNLFGLIKDANKDSKPIIIAGSSDEKSAVLISKKDYDAQQETMALLLNGQLTDAIARENDEDVDLDEMMKDLANE